MTMTTWLAMAPAPGGAASGGGGGAAALVSFLPLVLIFAVFWFLIIRPQQKQQKARQAMIAAIKSGDRVITTGGLFATVKDVHDDYIVAFISEGIKVEISKHAVTGVVDKRG
jgi:preprotein translocase subunit YajC